MKVENLFTNLAVYPTKHVKLSSYDLKQQCYFTKYACILACVYYFGKIKYLGKSYRLIFKPNYLNCRFGRSHMSKFYYKQSGFKLVKKKKNLYLFRIKSREEIGTLKQIVKGVRATNHYTKRGLRVSKQKYKKRFGKISQAFTGLH